MFPIFGSQRAAFDEQKDELEIRHTSPKPQENKCLNSPPPPKNKPGCSFSPCKSFRWGGFKFQSGGGGYVLTADLTSTKHKIPYDGVERLLRALEVLGF